jgi:hypothetical protein
MSQDKRSTAQTYTGRPGSDMSIANLERDFATKMSVGKDRKTSEIDGLSDAMSSMNLGYGSRGPTYSSTKRDTFRGGKRKKSCKRKKGRNHKKSRKYRRR